jgi:hypothetical protein
MIIKKELTATDVGPLKRIVLPKASNFQESSITMTFGILTYIQVDFLNLKLGNLTSLDFRIVQK